MGLLALGQAIARAWDLAEVIPLAQLASAEAEDGDVPLGKLLALCDLLYDLAHLAGVHGAGHDVEAGTDLEEKGTDLEEEGTDPEEEGTDPFDPGPR